MRGEFLVVASNNRVQFKLTIRRNLTILKGNSATGKTTLLDLVAAYDELGSSSGVTVRCDVPCHVLSGKDWARDLTGYSSCIIFIDEDSAFMRSCEFASMAKASDNYYVLVARESLHQLPYSVDEIYGLKNSNRSTTKYPVYSRIYASTYRIYSHSMASVLPFRHSSCAQFSVPSRTKCRQVTPCRASSASGTKAGTTPKTIFKLRALSFCFCPKGRGGTPLEAR